MMENANQEEQDLINIVAHTIKRAGTLPVLAIFIPLIVLLLFSRLPLPGAPAPNARQRRQRHIMLRNAVFDHGRERKAGDADILVLYQPLQVCAEPVQMGDFIRPWVCCPQLARRRFDLKPEVRGRVTVEVEKAGIVGSDVTGGDG
jgi:hypothetical protein